jgi:ribosomal-protein-alanine N-acetyltransferase
MNIFYLLTNMHNIVFETARLIVRKLVREDLHALHELQNNFHVMQYATGKAQSYEENIADIEHVIACCQQEGNTFRVWALEEKTSGHFIGTVALIVLENGENDLGYRLMEKHWGKGYGLEVAEGLLQYAFEVLSLEDVVGVADVRNTASLRILEKLMVFEFEAYNPELDCVDRAYRVTIDHWKNGRP